MTNVELKKRGMTTDDLCPCCRSSPEITIHLLRDCDDIRDFWYTLVEPDLCSRFFLVLAYILGLNGICQITIW